MPADRCCQAAGSLEFSCATFRTRNMARVIDRHMRRRRPRQPGQPRRSYPLAAAPSEQQRARTDQMEERLRGRLRPVLFACMPVGDCPHCSPDRFVRAGLGFSRLAVQAGERRAGQARSGRPVSVDLGTLRRTGCHRLGRRRPSGRPARLGAANPTSSAGPGLVGGEPVLTPGRRRGGQSAALRRRSSAPESSTNRARRGGLRTRSPTEQPGKPVFVPFVWLI